ncbi:MAG TPA: DUF3489 domain-containing protein [Rickettsiales bacterium]|nr:DUF3489 domain-containing protein [Rickettsiales bacterium]
MIKNAKPTAVVATKIKAPLGKPQPGEVIRNRSNNDLLKQSRKAPVAHKPEVQNAAVPEDQLPSAEVGKRGSKQSIIINLLMRTEGVTLPELVQATGWQKHSIHGTLSGVLKKKLGLTIISDQEEERGGVYRIQTVKA